MSDKKVNDLMGITFDKMKTMVDVDTVMGTPINTADGTTVIPVCKVNYGFATGGSDLPSKNHPTAGYFGGGSGGSVSLAPVAFLIVKDGNARIMQVEPFTSSVDRVVQMAPDVIDRIIGLFKKEDVPAEEKTEEIEE